MQPVRDLIAFGPGSPAAQHPEELAEARLWLDRLRIHHLDLTNRFITAGGGDLYVTDLVIGAVMTRSYSMVQGFIGAFDLWNPVVCAPILRMQIDSLVRLSYLLQAPAVEDVAKAIVDGTEFRKMKDKDNKALSDRRLIELAGPRHPWVKEVYAEMSGWVHFSPDHVRAAWWTKDTEDGGTGGSGTLTSAIPLQPDNIGPFAMGQLLDAMVKATEELFAYVEAWESHKEGGVNSSSP